jgi:CBS domain-containing protein
MSLRETLTMMNRVRGDAAVVVDGETDIPLGLVTLRDMLHLITFEAGSLDEPVVAYMIGAPLTVAADAPAHRAKVLMAKRGIHHVLLVDAGGGLVGVVSQSDLLGLSSGRTENLIDAIAAARDVDAMTLAADQVRRRGAELFAGGLGVEGLSQWMSGLNDLICMRIIELIADEFDLPGIPWCWMLFGSEGRLEQTFTSDQDNGLIFLPAGPEDTEATRSILVSFAQAVNKALHLCGFERCRGDIMAGNPKWCLSEQEWWSRFDGWLRVPEPEALLRSTIFFDFRPLYGNHELVDRLRGRLLTEAKSHDRFFRAMAEEALTCSPPLGWAGQFVYERDRDYPHTIDLKLRGARPFTDAARIWSLRHGIWATNTAERLRAAGAATSRPPEDVAAEVEAFHLIQRFRIQQQIATRDRDQANRIDPADLNELHRLMLKEAFRQAKKLQLRLRQEHGL